MACRVSSMDAANYDDSGIPFPRLLLALLSKQMSRYLMGVWINAGVNPWSPCYLKVGRHDVILL